MYFYKNYLALCNRAGKSPSAVALEIGLSKTSVNRWKNGGGITDATVAKVAEYFKVPVGVIVGNGDSKTLAENIKHYAGSFSYDTPEDIAKKIGVAPERFNAWLSGEEYPSISDIDRLADHFGVMREDLVNVRPTEQEEFYHPAMMDTMTFDAMCKFKCLSPTQQKLIIRQMETFILGKAMSFPEMDKK